MASDTEYQEVLARIEAEYNWNLGQAQMDFDLDVGYTRLPVGLEREA